MTPTMQKALVAIETGVMAFGGAVVMSVEQRITADGWPATYADWGHVLAGAMATAAFSLFARYRTVPGTLSVPVSTGVPVAKAAERGFATLRVLVVILLVIGAGALVNAIVGCAPGVTPQSAWQKLVGDVKAGVAAHDTEPQLEAIVVNDLGQDISPQAAIYLDMALVAIEDGLEIAQAVGSAPPSYEADIHAQVRAKIAAAGAHRP